jgi:hypothetical protein
MSSWLNHILPLDLVEAMHTDQTKIRGELFWQARLIRGKIPCLYWEARNTHSSGSPSCTLHGEDTMPKVELTYQQVLEVVKQLTPQEQEQLEAALRASSPSLEQQL